MKESISSNIKLQTVLAFFRKRIYIDKENLGQILSLVIILVLIITNIRLLFLISEMNKRLVGIDIRIQRLANMDSNAPSVVIPEKNAVEITWDGAATLGPLDAPVVIVEFADFQCPFCSASNVTIQQLLRNYEGKVLFAYRHFPLPNHPQSMNASEASECAREQGKFWEMYDLLYANGNTLSDESYENLASKLQLNIIDFNNCMTEHRYKQNILKDVEEGRSYGVSGTPTFFINGYIIPGNMDKAQFEKVIDSFLNFQKE